MKMDEKYSMNTELDPEVVKVRDKIINKIGNKPCLLYTSDAADD